MPKPGMKTVEIPASMHEWLKEDAKAQHRTITHLLQWHIERSYQFGEQQQDLTTMIDNLHLMQRDLADIRAALKIPPRRGV